MYLDELLNHWTHQITMREQHDGSETTISSTSFDTFGPRTLLVCREREAMNSINILQALKAGHTNAKITDDNLDFTIQKQMQQAKTYAFLIGPEGGWSQREEEVLDNYASKFPSIIQSVSLSDNKYMILRAETAAIMAIGAWALVCG